MPALLRLGVVDFFDQQLASWIVNLGPYQCQESSFIIILPTLRITLQM
jgi:hypothetical protein